jgi:hypothetical protein
MKKANYSCIFLFALLAGCSSTYVTSSWKSQDATAKIREYNKILVMGILSDTNRDLRQNMEKDLVQDLRSRGINAESAFEVYGPARFKRMNEQQVNDQIRKKGYDGVITIAMLNKDKEKYYVPGSVYYTPWAYNYGYFWSYYSDMYDRVYEAGYYETGTDYLWESNLYDLNNGRIIYSVQSKSFDPENAQSLGRDYGKKIMADLVKNGLLEKQKVK